MVPAAGNRRHHVTGVVSVSVAQRVHGGQAEHRAGHQDQPHETESDPVGGLLHAATIPSLGPPGPRRAHGPRVALIGAGLVG
nr:hypothetical protein Aca09nite_86020 [Actinoplanes campanulatus]